MVNMEIPKGYYEEELKRALDDFEKSILNNGMSKTEFLISIAKTEGEIKKAEESIFALAGHEFNVSSPKQLGVVLFEEMKVGKP